MTRFIESAESCHKFSAVHPKNGARTLCVALAKPEKIRENLLDSRHPRTILMLCAG
jgi:hypothetical protein